jgi:hypothetical protein
VALRGVQAGFYFTSSARQVPGYLRVFALISTD